ncbi:MAG TPA: M20/M25/M40 family metallo-hydrolase [Blastocatellia bacterium]|nr:M20/M25/M40 family metallo-hydrolase [Blastocatellia bacterium]
MKKHALYLLTLILINPLSTLAQESPNADVHARIRQEEMHNSQIMRTLHFLADVYGPRLTGSPNLKQAGEWAIDQMTAWGLENAHLEPWDFGHPGWLNERLTAHIVSPVKDHLTCEVLAWTPGTSGTLTAPAYQMFLPDKPTQADFTAYLDSVGEKVRGKIVLAGKHQLVQVTIEPAARRTDDKVARSRYDPNNPNAGQFGRPGGPQEPQKPEPGPPKLTPAQINEQLDKFLVANGALARVNDAGREHGQIRAFSNRTYDPSKVVPTVVMRNEDYGRIARIMADGRSVELEFNIVNRLFPEGRTAYNAIAEIVGTDKKDELIMLGGHLDSWHAATGATDNAIGCAIMMEAVRILKAIGVRPRRTIRVALWSGEEQGLLGSHAYVKEHFGSFENPKPKFLKVGAYFNIDSGTGRARGMGVFGPPESAAVLRAALAGFTDLGFVGVIATKSRGLGGSDNGSFNQAGLPGIGIGQDPIEYFTDTWHTNLDNYERVIEDDAKNAAIVIAAAVYHLATRDELLPRFSKADMPVLPPAAPAPPTRP